MALLPTDRCVGRDCSRSPWAITADENRTPPRVFACPIHLDEGCRRLGLPVVIVWVPDLGAVRCREYNGGWHTETTIDLWLDTAEWEAALRARHPAPVSAEDIAAVRQWAGYLEPTPDWESFPLTVGQVLWLLERARDSAGEDAAP